MTFYLSKHKQLIKFVSLSVVVHILVLFVVSQQSTSNKLKKAQSKELKPRIIQAQLIYQKAAVKPQKPQPQEPPKKPKKPKVSLNETPVVTEKSLVKKANPQKAEPSKVKVETAKPKKVDKSNKADLLKKTKPVKKTEPHKEKAIKPVTRSDIRAASKKYFSTIPEPPPFNPEFSNGSTSIIAINNKASAVPQHHKSIDNTGTMGAPRPTKVLCDNTIGVATAIMSGLTGGTVQCEPLPDVSEFLKKRNKEKYNR